VLDSTALFYCIDDCVEPTELLLKRNGCCFLAKQLICIGSTTKPKSYNEIEQCSEVT
jgi:hypothetical protein